MCNVSTIPTENRKMPARIFLPLFLNDIRTTVVAKKILLDIFLKDHLKAEKS